MGRGRKTRRAQWTPLDVNVTTISSSNPRASGSIEPPCVLDAIDGLRKSMSSAAAASKVAETEARIQAKKDVMMAEKIFKEKRERQMYDFRNCTSPEEALAKLDTIDPSDHGLDYDDFDKTVGLFKKYPGLALEVLQDWSRFSNKFRTYDKAVKEMYWALKYKLGPHMLPVETDEFLPQLPETDEKYVEAFRVAGQDQDAMEDMVRGWFAEISKTHGGLETMELALNIGPLPDMTAPDSPWASAFQPITAFDLNREYARISQKHHDLPFSLKVLRGFEHGLKALLGRIKAHNFTAFDRFPVGPQYVVHRSGCFQRNLSPIDASNLTGDILTAPKSDVSYIVGKDGVAIKDLNKEMGLRGRGIIVQPHPASPQLPVIFISPVQLTDSQNEDVVMWIDEIARRMRPPMSW